LPREKGASAGIEESPLKSALEEDELELDKASGWLKEEAEASAGIEESPLKSALEEDELELDKASGWLKEEAEASAGIEESPLKSALEEDELELDKASGWLKEEAEASAGIEEFPILEIGCKSESDSVSEPGSGLKSLSASDLLAAKAGDRLDEEDELELRQALD
jgi:translation elongation factor EF-Ts